MIAGYHIIFSAYGFWLPNDPRGSWSDFVGSWELYKHGPATKTSDGRSLADRPHDVEKRLAAKTALLRPPVVFTGVQARSIGVGFGKYFRKCGVSVYACAVMPDHVHLVIGRTNLRIEQLIIQLKGEATRQLERDGCHPFAHLRVTGERLPRCWVRGGWKVFLEPSQFGGAIQYVRDNPVKQGLPAQRWSFVVPNSEERSASRRG